MGNNESPFRAPDRPDLAAANALCATLCGTVMLGPASCTVSEGLRQCGAAARTTSIIAVRPGFRRRTPRGAAHDTGASLSDEAVAGVGGAARVARAAVFIVDTEHAEGTVLSFIAIVIGGILGLGWGDSGYAGAIGALAGWLLVRSWQQQRRIGALEQAHHGQYNALVNLIGRG